MIRKMILVAAALPLWVGAVQVSARAQPGEAIRFSAGPVEFTLTAPAGYCVAEGEKAAAAARVAAYSSTTRNLVALVPCAEKRSPLDADFIFVSIPTRDISPTMKRSQILSDPSFANRPDPGPSGEQRMMTRPNGTQAEMTLGTRLLGHDDLCGYVGGTNSVGNASATVAGCLTEHGGRTMMIVAMVNGGEQAAIPHLKALTRTVAGGIVPVRR